MKLLYLPIIILIISGLSSCVKDNDIKKNYTITQLTFLDKNVDAWKVSSDEKFIYYTVMNYAGGNQNPTTEIYSLDLESKQTQKIGAYLGFSQSFTVNENGNKVALAVSLNTENGVEYELVLLDKISSEQKLLLRTSESLSASFFCEQDQSLIFTRQRNISVCYCHTIWKIELEKEKMYQISENYEEESHAAVDLSSDKSLILVQEDFKGGHVMDTNGQVRYFFSRNFKPVMFSPDAQAVAGRTFLGLDGNDNSPNSGSYQIAIRKKGSETVRLTDLDGECYPKGFSDDGNKIFFSFHSRNFSYPENEVYSVDTQTLTTKKLVDHKFKGFIKAVINNGKQILYESSENSFRNIYLLEI